MIHVFDNKGRHGEAFKVKMGLVFVRWHDKELKIEVIPKIDFYGDIQSNCIKRFFFGGKNIYEAREISKCISA